MHRRSSKLWVLPAIAFICFPMGYTVGGFHLSPWWGLLIVPVGWWSAVKAYDALRWDEH